MRSPIAAAALTLLIVPAAWALDREISATHKATGLSELELITGNGSVTVTPSPGDEVHVYLTVSPRKGGGGDKKGVLGWLFTSRLDQQEMLDSIELSTTEKDGRLVIRPLPRGGARQDQVTERWVVEVPARFAVNVEADSSAVAIHGIEGGVRLRQGHGKAIVDVPGGAVDLALAVGDIQADVGSAHDSAIDVRSKVGDTKVWLDDRRVTVNRPPGPGSYFRLEGDAHSQVAIRVTVGNVKLRLSEG